MSQNSTNEAFGNRGARPTAAEIAQFLNDNLEQLPRRLGLKDIHVSADEIRCGPRGHISISRKDGGGRRRGWWNDFKGGSGSDMLDFVAYILGYSISDAMKWVAGWYSTSSFTPSSARRNQDAGQKDDQHAALIKKIRWASQIWQQTVPIAGTVAEAYIRETRRLTGHLGAALRFHPHLYHRSADGVVTYWPALICAVTIAPHTHVSGIWRIYLSPNGKKAPVDTAKKGLGATIGHGGAVRLTAASEHLHVAEGVENGLAALSLKPSMSGQQADKQAQAQAEDQIEEEVVEVEDRRVCVTA